VPHTSNPEPSHHVLDSLTDELGLVERKASSLARRAATARNQSKRRRMIDPATCERDYSQAEVEFMQAMQAYKVKSGRIYPTWSEVLEVVRDLGYRKMEHSQSADTGPTASQSA